MTSDSHLSAPVRLLFRLVLTMALVWFMSNFLDQFFYVTGGLIGNLILSSLITLMNVLARPLLHVLFLPFRFFFSLLGLIAANALFLWILERIALALDPALVTLTIDGGWIGWLLIACLLGFANWLMKEMLR